MVHQHLLPLAHPRMLLPQRAALKQRSRSGSGRQLAQLGVALPVVLTVVDHNAVDGRMVEAWLRRAAHLEAPEGTVLAVRREGAHLMLKAAQRSVLLRTTRGAALLVSQLQLPSDQPARKRDVRLSHNVRRGRRRGRASLVDAVIKQVGPLLLVPPVRRDAVLRNVVHLGCADLHLKRQPVVATHHGVQTLVAVLLAVADEVLEAPLHWLPQPMHLAKRGVAVRLAAHDHSNSTHVVYLVHCVTLLAHLLK
mmetsp:Transcript_23841/g.42428  ORF Transcript_23841/g.42428 Transcript_23841/m.42428 type:complete len:251 (+) Transcript_23841:708-1460(+)